MRDKERPRFSGIGVDEIKVGNQEKGLDSESPWYGAMKRGFKMNPRGIHRGLREMIQDGGAFEINVTGLSGLLADGQTPAAHNTDPATITPVTSDRLLGRDTAGSGAAEQITVAGNLEFTGAGGIQRGALTGDVTATAGSGATTIAPNVVTNGQLFPMDAYSFKVNLNNATSSPTDSDLADFTEEGAPASGDFVIGFNADGSIKKYDIGNLPSGGGGSKPDVTDGTTTVTAPSVHTFDGDDFDVTDSSPSADIAIKRNVDNGIQGLDSEAKIATAVLSRRVIEHTSSQSILSEESFTIFTNKGAGGSITLSLPTAAAGLEYTFVIMETQTLVIDAAAGDTIQIAGSTSAASGNISAATQGHTVTIVAMDATEWIAHSVIGTWTVT